jgi:hypothetical protein
MAVLSTALSPLVANGMAAWRSGGISALPFKSALPPPLRQTARCTLAFSIKSIAFFPLSSDKI